MYILLFLGAKPKHSSLVERTSVLNGTCTVTEDEALKLSEEVKRLFGRCGMHILPNWHMSNDLRTGVSWPRRRLPK